MTKIAQRLHDFNETSKSLVKNIARIHILLNVSRNFMQTCEGGKADVIYNVTTPQPKTLAEKAWSDTYIECIVVEL